MALPTVPPSQVLAASQVRGGEEEVMSGRSGATVCSLRSSCQRYDTPGRPCVTSVTPQEGGAYLRVRKLRVTFTVDRATVLGLQDTMVNQGPQQHPLTADLKSAYSFTVSARRIRAGRAGTCPPSRAPPKLETAVYRLRTGLPQVGNPSGGDRGNTDGHTVGRRSGEQQPAHGDRHDALVLLGLVVEPWPQARVSPTHARRPRANSGTRCRSWYTGRAGRRTVAAATAPGPTTQRSELASRAGYGYRHSRSRCFEACVRT